MSMENKGSRFSKIHRWGENRIMDVSVKVKIRSVERFLAEEEGKEEEVEMDDIDLLLMFLEERINEQYKEGEGDYGHKN